ncbi:MAG TPA: hypothetical protein VD735_00120 [Candidatus Saccharimonadales bacterium]|nr:hypothetical protein [Candidatus Saccharimonadales bacterium]
MSSPESGRPTKAKEGKVEKGARYLRNINFLSAAALAGAAVVLPPAVAPIAVAGALWNMGEGAVDEVVRRKAKKRRKAAH